MRISNETSRKLAGRAVFAWAVLALTLEIRAAAEFETVRVDGRPLLQVGSLPTMTAEERARQIERRIGRVLSNGGPASRAVTRPSPTNELELVISVSALPVLTVTPGDAEENLTTVPLLARQWENALNQAVEEGRKRRLSNLARFKTEVQGAITTAFSRLTESAIRIIPRALAASFVIGMFWLLAAAVRWLMRQIFRRIVEDLTVENLIKQVAYYAVWTLGLLVAADAFGLNTKTIVTGLGLTSLALGFALKDILSNFVSGILILVLRPFELGDQIVVGETEGAVERIELRATQIRAYDGRTILVPNAEVFTSRITNNTRAPVRRGTVKVMLGYDQDLRRAVEVICSATAGAEGVLNEPEPTVRIQELGPSDIVLEARFWTDSRRSDFVATCSMVRQAVVRELSNAGIGLPDPEQRKVFIQGNDDSRR